MEADSTQVEAWDDDDDALGLATVDLIRRGYEPIGRPFATVDGRVAQAMRQPYLHHCLWHECQRQTPAKNVIKPEEPFITSFPPGWPFQGWGQPMRVDPALEPTDDNTLWFSWTHK